MVRSGGVINYASWFTNFQERQEAFTKIEKAERKNYLFIERLLSCSSPPGVLIVSLNPEQYDELDRVKTMNVKEPMKNQPITNV
jgi:hypothetical protein